MTSSLAARRRTAVSDPFVPVAPASDLQPGHPRTLTAGGREIAVFNVDGRFYAIDNTCPHQGAPLTDGWLEGTTITCPWHAWCFDLGTGSLTLGPFAFVDTFEVRIAGGMVEVDPRPRPRPDER